MSVLQLNLLDDIPVFEFQSIAEAALKLEAYETPAWAAQAGLNAVPLLDRVLDPCVGRGILAQTALQLGHDVRASDVYRWEYDGPRTIIDFLDPASSILVDGWEPGSFDVFVNPPFSKACEFIDRAFELGARKVLCFQRLAWLESDTRREWWDLEHCRAVHLCAKRATCWGFHIGPEKRKSSSPTPHAWYEFDQMWKGEPLLKRLYH
ncbi:MAG: hypothetical protein ACFHHU_00395 [Porticoccaceae bacterium]